MTTSHVSASSAPMPPIVRADARSTMNANSVSMAVM